MNNDQLYFYNRGFNDCLAKGLNPAKTLTDEEITKIYNEILIHDKKSSIKFARAILIKAQGEG